MIYMCMYVDEGDVIERERDWHMDIREKMVKKTQQTTE